MLKSLTCQTLFTEKDFTLKKIKHKIIVFACLFYSLNIHAAYSEELQGLTLTDKSILSGAERTSLYLEDLKGKRVAIIANQSSRIVHQTENIENTKEAIHLVDFLIMNGVNVVKIFCPEHGLRGNADAGEVITNSMDEKTKLPIISLYGTNKKPKTEDLKNIDVILFDIQDVGVRYYTYISTMQYAMQAVVENNIEFIVLDRPNPNGFYVDGPVLESGMESFTGMHKVPLVHGLTVGEFALFIQGEGYLKAKNKIKLKVIPILNYTHKDFYSLPIKSSPNLPNMKSVYLYPSVGLLESTVMSVGRGTDFPFQAFGHPNLKNADFLFTPKSVPGAKNPPLVNKACKGIDVSKVSDSELQNKAGIRLEYLLFAYKNYPDKKNFFNPLFDFMAGNKILRTQIVQGLSEKEIKASWQANLESFKKTRKKYLLYEDF